MLERAESQVKLTWTVFVGDHHVTDYAYYQNSPILARMLAHWFDKPAGALYLLPLWHPVLLAEQIATGCDHAWSLYHAVWVACPNKALEWALMSQRVAMFEDSLTIMRQLWAGETVNHDRFWGLNNAHRAVACTGY